MAAKSIFIYRKLEGIRLLPAFLVLLAPIRNRDLQIIITEIYLLPSGKTLRPSDFDSEPVSFLT